MSNSFVTPWTIAHCPWDSSGENAGVGCHFLLQAIFLIKRLNPQLLPHLLLSHQGSPFSGNRSLSPTSLWLWNHDGDREHVNSTCLSCCHLKLFTSTLKPISLSTSPSPQPPDIPISVNSLLLKFFKVVFVFHYPPVFPVTNMSVNPDFCPAENISGGPQIPCYQPNPTVHARKYHGSSDSSNWFPPVPPESFHNTSFVTL